MSSPSPIRRRLEQVFRASLAAVDPGARVRAALARGDLIPLLARRPVQVVAVGKAAAPMARAAVAVLAQQPGSVSGIVVAPEPVDAAPLTCMVGEHPVPRSGSLAAGQAVWALAATTPSCGVLLALVSGGASALIEHFPDGVNGSEATATICELARVGAPIADLNAFRRGVSAIKGGRLALCCPAPVVTVAVSDVSGDEVDTIGSGPTLGPWTRGDGRITSAPDRGTYEASLRQSALRAWQAHLGRTLPPPSVAQHLGAPIEVGGTIERPADTVVLAAGLAALRKAAATAARAAGWEPIVVAADLVGDVEEVARRLISAADRLGPGQVLVAGGEPTLTLPVAPGRGGRAQHLALTLARRWAGHRDRAALIVGSDGVDGPAQPPAAGAFIDANSWQGIADAGVDAAAALEHCDSGSALAAIGALVQTGPTGVNHADLFLVAHP